MLRESLKEINPGRPWRRSPSGRIKVKGGSKLLSPFLVIFQPHFIPQKAYYLDVLENTQKENRCDPEGEIFQGKSRINIPETGKGMARA